MAQEKEYIDAKDVAEFIEPEDVVLEDAPYLSGAWTPEVKTKEEAFAVFQKYAPEVLADINQFPEKWDLQKTLTEAAYLKDKNKETELREHFGYAPGAKVALDELTLRNRAELAGFDPMNLPEDPGTLGAISASLPQNIPFYDELRGALANTNAIREAATGKTEPTRLSEMLQKTSPDLYARLQRGDASVSDEQIKDAVTEGVRKEEAIAGFYSPVTSAVAGTVPSMLAPLGAAKVFGAKVLKPAVVTAIEALYGAGRGEDLLTRTGGAAAGALGGYLGARTGTGIGTKAAEFGVGKAPVKGMGDIRAANRAQQRINKLLEPAKEEAFSEYVKGQTQAEREILAKAVKELRTKAKEANKAYQNMTTASQKYTVDMAKHEDAIRKAAEDAAAGKLGYADAEKIIAKEKEAALQLARRMSSGKTEKGLLSDYEKATLGLTEANASLEKALRSQAGLVGAKSRSQLEAFSNALPQLKQQIAEDVLPPEEQLTYSRLNLRRGELGREALRMSPQKEAAYEMAPVIEAKKQKVDFWKKKVEEAAAPAGEKALPPSADPELYQKILQQRLQEREATGFLPKRPEEIQQEAQRIMSTERPSLLERYSLAPEETRLAAERAKLAPLTPSTLSREQLVEQAAREIKKPEYRETLLAEMPKQRAVLEAPFAPKEEDLAKQLSSKIFREEEPVRERFSVKVPFIPGYLSFGKQKPSVSSAELPPALKYLQLLKERTAAQEAMATPVAVPLAQGATRTFAQDVLAPASGQESTFLNWLNENDEVENAIKKLKDLKENKEK